MTEQFRLQQVVRHAAAVLHHQRAAAARRIVMDRARQQLLARPGLALDQDRQFCLAALRARSHRLQSFSLRTPTFRSAGSADELSTRVAVAEPRTNSPETLNSRANKRCRRASSRASRLRLTMRPICWASMRLSDELVNRDRRHRFRRQSAFRRRAPERERCPDEMSAVRRGKRHPPMPMQSSAMAASTWTSSKALAASAEERAIRMR